MDKDHQHAVARARRLPRARHGDARATRATSTRSRAQLRFPVVLKPRNAPEFRHRFRAHLLRRPTPRSCGGPGTLAGALRARRSARSSPAMTPASGRYGSYRDAAGRALAAFTGPQAAPVAARLRRGPSGRVALGPRPGGALRRPARRARLPRPLAGRGEARPARRARLPHRGQRAGLALDRARHRLRREPAARVLARRRAGAPASGRRGTAAAGAGCSRARTWSAAPARCAAGEWSAAAFLRSLRAAGARRRHRPARPAAGPGPLRAPRAAARSAVAELRIRIAGCRPAFAPRARWVLETLAEAPRAGAGLDRRGGRPRLRARPARGRRLDPRRPGRPGLLRGARGRSRGRPSHRGGGPDAALPAQPPRRAAAGRPGRERLLPARPLGRAARRPTATASAASRWPPARSGGSRGSTWRTRRSRATWTPCGAALRHPAADALGRRPDPRHRPHPPAHAQRASPGSPGAAGRAASRPSLVRARPVGQPARPAGDDLAARGCARRSS